MHLFWDCIGHYEHWSLRALTTMFAMILTSVGLMWVQFFVLREALREVSWLRPFSTALRNSSSRLEGLKAGTPVPRLRAAVLGSSRRFTSRDLNGKPSLLLFIVGAAENKSSGQLRLVIDAFNDRVDGNVYVICSGPQGPCELAHGALLSPSNSELGPTFTTLEDPGGFIARAFHVQRTPAAVRVSEDGLVEQYGFPLEVVKTEIPTFAVLKEDKRG